MTDALFLLVLIAGFGGFAALVTACDRVVRTSTPASSPGDTATGEQR